MAESIGGYDYEFIEDLPEDLTCTLCHFAYKHPVQIEDCGHTFCKECFNQMKDHALANSLDLCCPLDRQKIDVARVFNVKSEERRNLNLMVKCPNFGDKCDWTGELREVLIHEKTCCKNETMFPDVFVMELKQLFIRVNELESKVKTNEHQLVEKDMKITSQCKVIDNLNKELKDLGNQNKTIDNQNKQFKNQTKQQGDNQNKKIENLSKRIEEQNMKIEDQNMKIEDQKQQLKDQKIQIEVMQDSHTQMIIPNIADKESFSSIPTNFQWKFNLTEIKLSRAIKYSSPFYNIINSYCFQLEVVVEDNTLRIILVRYRGKYDSDISCALKTTEEFYFQINVFGKRGKRKEFSFKNNTDYSISKFMLKSNGWSHIVNIIEIEDLTIDGFIHFNCFFSKI